MTTRGNPDPVHCAAGTCRERVVSGQLMCRAHWLALPRELRPSILITFRHRMVRAYQSLVAKAVDLIETRERDPLVDRFMDGKAWAYFRVRAVA